MKVLIPIEDDDFADLQVDFVLKHSWPENTSVYILNVVSPIYSDLAGNVTRETRHWSERLVKKMVHRIEQERPRWGFTTGIKEGEAADVILEAAKTWKADMIVLGSHGRHGLGKVVLGSVAFDILAKSPCQTVIIGKPHLEEEHARVAMQSYAKLRFS
jgi:nucleotide-binding universal stress UspA family protein